MNRTTFRLDPSAVNVDSLVMHPSTKIIQRLSVQTEVKDKCLNSVVMHKMIHFIIESSLQKSEFILRN